MRQGVRLHRLLLLGVAASLSLVALGFTACGRQSRDPKLFGYFREPAQ